MSRAAVKPSRSGIQGELRHGTNNGEAIAYVEVGPAEGIQFNKSQFTIAFANVQNIHISGRRNHAGYRLRISPSVTIRSI